MKIDLLKRLSACLPVGMAFIITAVLFTASANAQIVYTDVNPDVVRGCNYPGPCSANYLIDLNNDGINDFTFSPTAKGFSCGNCSPNTILILGTRDSALVISTVQSWISDTVGGFGLIRLIDSSLAWTNTVHTLAQNGERCQVCPSGFGSFKTSQGITGNWINVSGKFMGLKVKVGSDFYYGWIKLGVSIASYSVSITIMEYAYNSTPNQPILAGQTVATGITENSFASSINLFPNPATDKLTIALGSNYKKAKITIADITGKVIYTTIATDPDSYREQMIEVNTQDFAAGIYVVQIQTGEFLATKRLVVEK
ncbi:MAG: T9SS type A sorting domain-containing protein [Bacteroidia bacterium]|nr:T9SS type A sorting domain-containing protein [Bacteroidia bacterium]